jgi:hypothetical protein
MHMWSKMPTHTWVHPRFLVGSVLLLFLVFLCCSIMWLYVLSSVLWCPLRFLLKTMLCSSLSPVVCRRTHVLFTLFVHNGVQHILCCVFVLFFFVFSTLCCLFLWIDFVLFSSSLVPYVACSLFLWIIIFDCPFGVL